MVEVQGAKFWWRWENHSFEAWSRLWHIKYVCDRPTHQLVRFNEALSGSPIWMKEMTGRIIVQNHSFWEIRDGSNAKFWDDSWNQLPTLGRDPRWIHLKEKALEEGKV